MIADEEGSEIKSNTDILLLMDEPTISPKVQRSKSSSRR